MILPITDIPVFEPLRSTSITEKTQNMTASPLIPVRIANTCYTLTGPDFFCSEMRDDYTLASRLPGSDKFDSQVAMISLASELFRGSKPVSNEIMLVLNKTFARLRSKVPTKL